MYVQVLHGCAGMSLLRRALADLRVAARSATRPKRRVVQADVATRAAQSNRNFSRASGHSWASDSDVASRRSLDRMPGAVTAVTQPAAT